jgi:hypothetical protein
MTLGLLAAFVLTGCKKQAAPVPAAGRDEATQRVSGESDLKRFALRIEATFKSLPKGAHIVAPVARDRRYQKIKKTEHKGVKGTPLLTADGENLIFVSAPVEQESATYTAYYEFELRRVMPGSFSSIAGQDYGPFRDPKLEAVMKAHPKAPKNPHKVVNEAFGTFREGQEAAPLAIAQGFAKTLAEAGVPHRLVQGLLFREGKAVPHAWVEALLPRLGWAPFDPWMARETKTEGYCGQHPPDRVRILFGEKYLLPKSSKSPSLSLKAPLMSPKAVLASPEGLRDAESVVTKITYDLRPLVPVRE